MREKFTLWVRVGSSGRSGEFHLGRTGLLVAVGVLALLLVVTTQFIYDYRHSLSELRELRGLRVRVSEQNLTLYNLHAKFESLETELERLRMLDARVRSLVKLDDTIRGGGKEGRNSGVGGSETPGEASAGRLDRLLDLRFERIKENMLVDVKNLEAVRERLDVRRIVLESLPSLWPVRGMLTSAFGVRISPFTETRVFHQGLDINAPVGTSVKAAAGGKVVKSGYESLYGNIIIIEHGHGYRTVYAHLSERLVEAGDLVEKAGVIGKVGVTGRTTGPHLHYEVHVNGLPVNPARFL